MGIRIDRNQIQGEKMTEKYLRVTMEDGSQYDVPSKTIAINRAEYFADKDTDGTRDERLIDQYNYCMDDDSELIDWATNNMNWSDVKDQAEKVTDNKDVNFQEGWVNGEHEVITK